MGARPVSRPVHRVRAHRKGPPVRHPASLQFLIAATLIVLTSSTAFAQTPALDWVHQYGGYYEDVGRSLALDASGNILLSGSFAGAADFGDGTPVYSQLSSPDGYVAKYNSVGGLIWARGFGGSGVDYSLAAAVDDSGNAVVTGSFYYTADFGNGPLTSAGAADIFVAKYSAAGVPMWSRRFGSASDDTGYGIAVDGAGSVIVTGHLPGTVNFGGGSLTSAGGTGAFVAKFDRNGVHQWSKAFGSSASMEAPGLAMGAGGDLALTGYFYDPVSFGGDTLLSAGESDIFVARFTADGTQQWTTSTGGWSCDAGQAVAITPGGAVLATGAFKYDVSIGGNPFTSMGGSQDIFLARYSKSTGAAGGGPSGSGLALAAYPNPASEGTTIRFEVPRRGRVRLGVYDVQGHCLSTLVDGECPAGSQVVRWGRTDDRGHRARPGVYFVRLCQDAEVTSRRLAIVR